VIAGGVADGDARTALWVVALAIDVTGPLVLYWLPFRRPLPSSAWAIQVSHLVERASSSS
jgi:low temperature requirement protein LtrA